MKIFPVLALLFFIRETHACSCKAPPENSVLFAQALVLAEASVVKIVKTQKIEGHEKPRATEVELKIKKVYKGDPQVMGQKVRLYGSHLDSTCIALPPSKLGQSVTIEGAGKPPYEWKSQGGCDFVWDPLAK